jgi:hypothetical protein
MATKAKNTPAMPDRPVATMTINTTLANLFEALQEEVPPGQEHVVVQIVYEMLSAGRLKLA